MQHQTYSLCKNKQEFSDFWAISYLYTYIYIYFFSHIAPFFFYIWSPAPEELSARPCLGATEHALFYGLKIKE